jgi:hypothetical protein
VGSLGIAKIGDAVIGKLSLEGSEPVVVTLAFMGNPQFGLPVPNKAGFMISPYAARRSLKARERHAIALGYGARSTIARSQCTDVDSFNGIRES